MKKQLLALLTLLAPLAYAGTAPVPPVEAFFSYPKISDVQISPDGRYLSMVIAGDKSGAARKGLAIFSLKHNKVTASFHTIGDQIIYRYWWANDERLLVATATQTGSLDSPLPDGKLFGINVDGSQLRQLMGMVPGGPDAFTHVGRRQELHYFQRMLYIPPQDAREVVVETYTGRDQPNEAYALDIYRGNVQRVAQSPTANGELFTDHRGAVRLATGSNTLTGVNKFYYRASGDSLDWRDLSALYRGDDPADSPLGPVGFAADDKTVYWLGRTASGTVGLYALDPDTQKTTLLYGDPNYDVEGIIGSLDWQNAGHVIAVTTMPGLPALHIIDGDDPLAGYLASLYDAFPGQMVEITSNTRDGAQMVLFVHSDRNPGAYYLFDAKKRKVSLLFKLLPDIDPANMAAMRPVTFKARDGLTLHGYLTLPPGSDGKNLPLILNPHGGPHGIRDRWGWDPEVQYFATHGYAVLQVNFRGSGGYGMKFQDLGYRHWATTMQSDLADAVHWAVAQGIADPRRICIYGASYGGYAALENSILYPDLYRCTVGYVGVYDLTLLGRSDFSHYASGDRYLNVVLGDNQAELEAQSPVYNVAKLKDALFIVYGGADKRVVPENARELMAALDRAGKKYQLMYEPNEGHGFTKPQHNFELYTRMLQFFDRNIGPAAARH